ncbi:hypothetical protein DSO57_1038037 [Entomophthora muscae]|uniref:Uncharacterized protein n=1 Tax=Entomophthora muscae TaxID=34485 RepID=A0ACC2SMS2_9FUNG|nr:hypothetical protein DSO57_1038037 [Entomophthora muscae]
MRAKTFSKYFLQPYLKSIKEEKCGIIDIFRADYNFHGDKNHCYTTINSLQGLSTLVSVYHDSMTAKEHRLTLFELLQCIQFGLSSFILPHLPPSSQLDRKEEIGMRYLP